LDFLHWLRELPTGILSRVLILTNALHSFDVEGWCAPEPMTESTSLIL
jgi:hypothetical protein